MIERMPKLDNAEAAAAEWHGCDDVADMEVTDHDLPRLRMEDTPERGSPQM
jgi:hypothetical protein